MKFLILAALLVAVFPYASSAQVSANKLSNDARGYTFEMCSGESTTGICDNGSGHIYARTDYFSNLSFFFTESGGSGSTCTIWGLPGRTSAVPSDLTTVDTFAINSTPLSASAPVQFFNLNVKYVFLSCTISGGNVTVHMMGSEPATSKGLW